MSHTNEPDGPNAKDPKKTADLPPYGPRNPDPLTDAPGSHPIETGVGALVGGAASGLAAGAAIGAAGGPLGIAIGAMIGGAVAGGLAGKGIGELIDPTTEDNWIRDYFARRKNAPDYDAETDPAATEAYRFGLRAESRFHGRSFDECIPALRSEWEAGSKRHWSDAKRPAQDGFEKARDLRVKSATPTGAV